MPEKLEEIKPIRALWVQAKEDTEIVEKGNTLEPHVYAALESYLKILGKHLYERFGLDGASFYVPVCPTCQGILGQMCMSSLLICLKCGREFQISEYKRPCPPDTPP